MLWMRLLTALILIPLVVAGVYILPSLWFEIILTIIMLLAGFEWTKLIGLKKVGAFCFITILAVLLLGSFYLGTFITYALIPICALFSILFSLIWIFPLISCLTYKGVTPFWAKSRAFLSLTGISLLYAAWSSITLLKVYFGSTAVMALLLIIWIADSGAYFTGRLFGKHALLKEVSPKKTWEGLLGGIILCLLFGTVVYLLKDDFYFLNWIKGFNYIAWTFFVIGTMIYSVIGDLFESLIKRIGGVKDSGTWLPGHGGILDRLDSLIAAAPFFSAGLVMMLQFAIAQR